ncbi:M64 family metallopeptidase [Tamlana flava]|uniref:M64 family metallopeptidase n=1 Tax=Tamlana flava TaxID=3158572 RepID=UPI00351B1441
MKHLLFILTLLFNIQVTLSQIFEIDNIEISGDQDNRINLVILSEGYQSSELAKFITDATNFTNSMFTMSPFSEYSNYFNVYALKVPSNESGADRPSTSTYVDTFFNATYEAFGSPYLLYYEIDGNSANNTEAKILNVLADNFPTYDLALILVNSNEYGGSGGVFPMAYSGYWGANVIVHEMGHSLFNLKDEYYPGDVLGAEAINMTQETDPNLVRWKNWLYDNGVGIYQYFDNNVPKDWYKPHQNCIMEKIDKTFCSVCKEGIVEKIHELISPIDNYTPNNNTVENPSSFPLDFMLNLIKPIPNTLESVWTLNGSNFANNVDGVSLLETNLMEGENTLTAVIHDNTSFQRVDNHNNFHVSLVTWTINYTTLGVEDIESKIDSYSISMFPNPASTTVNFMHEGKADSNLNIELVSLEGRMVKSVKISNLESYQLDISNLNQGIYIANFYSGKILIANKKLVKR